MKRVSVLVAVLTLAVSMLLPATALADSGTHTYAFLLEVPNVSEAPNGDSVAITGEGEFSVHPNAIIEGMGHFTHMNAGGTVLATGMWRATGLLDYQSYGCGVVHNFPRPGVTTDLPDNFCGGMVKMRVVQIDAILTIFCIIGPNPPNSHDDPSGEGIHLVVPGIINFNKIVEGMNVYVQQS